MNFRLKIILAFIAVLIIAQAKAQNSFAPFLYYYSAENEAFIVERADGTDSRILADYSLLENQFIWGAGWSMSGGWFAWSNGVINGSTLDSVFSIFVTDRDSNQIELYSGGQVLDMQWSPNEDKLLIKFLDAEQNNLITIHIIDMQSQSIIFSTDASLLGLGDFPDYRHSASLINANWINSGYFAVYHPVAMPDDQQFMMKIFTPTGDLLTERLFKNNGHMPFWSSTGQVLYSSAENGNLILEDFLSAEMIEFGVAVEDITYVDWHPNGLDALIYATRNTNRSSLYFLSTQDKTITLLSEMSQLVLPFYTGTQIGNSQTAWTDDGTRSYFIDESPELTDTRSSLFVFDYSSQITQSIYSNTNGIFDAQWFKNGNELLFSTDNSLLTYSTDTEQIITLLPEEHNVQRFSISPDDRFIGFSQSIFDVNTKDVIPATFEILQLGGFAYPDNYGWYSDEDDSWVLLSSYYIHTFGFVGVANVSGTLTRPLVSSNYCSLNRVCYGWLPASTSE